MNGRIFSRIGCVVGLGSVLLTAASCIRETPGHCVFENGDATCAEAFPGTFCIFQGPEFLDFAKEEYRNVSEAQLRGCFQSEPMMERHGRERSMFPEHFVCITDGLDEPTKWRSQMEQLDEDSKPNKRNNPDAYTFTRFVEDLGKAGEVYLEKSCPADMGPTTMDTSDSGTATTGTESSTTGGETSESSTTGPVPCTDNEDCTTLKDPQCVGGECRPCVDGADGDAACERIESTRPLCDGGMCVQCTPARTMECDVDLLACDPMTGSCVPCTEHAQCSSGACELALTERLCFPSDAVRVEVDGDGGADDTTLVGAVADVPNGGHGVIVVHALDNDSIYLTGGLGFRVVGAKTIALLAAPGELPVIQGTGGPPSLRVADPGTVLYVDGLTFAGNTSGLSLRVDSDALAWVDRSRIVQNSGGGILVELGGTLLLRNSFVAGPVDGDAIAVDGATLSLAYSTIGAGPVGVGRTRALFCENERGIDARNSILLSLDDDPEVECSAVVLTNSATEAEVGFSAAWFADYVNGDFSLSATGARTFAGVARWQDGDPTTDINGSLRPTVSGTADYAGADLP